MKLNSVMVYTDNLDNVIPFWCDTLSFDLVSDTNLGIRMIMIKASGETSLTFFSKEDMIKMNPEMNLGTPSLMFQTTELDEVHSKLKAKNGFVGDIMDHGGKRTFNFADLDQNYFAIQE